jgi:hypothetical protein
MVYNIFSFNCSHAADVSLFTPPEGMAIAKLGMSLQEFLKNHSNALNSMFNGTTNIDISRINQEIYLISHGTDLEFGKVGTNDGAGSIRSFAFSKFKMSESSLILTGEPEVIKKIQGGIIGDCLQKYGPHYEVGCRPLSLGTKYEYKAPVFTWKCGKQYLVVTCCPDNITGIDIRAVMVNIIAANHADLFLQLKGDECSTNDYKIIVEPMLKSIYRN